MKIKAIADFILPYAEYLDTAHPCMLLQQEVGGAGIDCELFSRTLMTIDQLKEEKGYQDVTILINTPGGDVNKGMGICHAMDHVKIPVDTFIINAKSMGACIASRGREVIMAEYGQEMIHEASFGDDETDKERKEELELANDSIAKLISSKRDISYDAVRKLMKRETWITSEEALELKLVDKIEKSENLNNTAKFAGTIVATANRELLKKKVA